MGKMAIGLCVLAALCFSEPAMQAASDAAEVFARGVLPALFPMLVLGGLLNQPQKAEHSHLPRTVLEAIGFSFAAGSPASAQRVRRLADAGRLPPALLAPLLCATGVMSPMFFVGTLASWTGLHAAAWTMLGAHWASALLSAALWALCAKGAKRAAKQPIASPAAPRLDPSCRQASLLTLLPGAVTSAAQALLSVCGAMMLFSIVAAVLRAMLGAAFPAWTRASEPVLAVAWGLLEIGSGSAAVLRAFPTPPLALLCALCSFGGLSICLQNLLFIGELIHPMRLLAMRLTHAAIAYALCTALLTLLPSLAQAFASVSFAASTSTAAALPPIAVAFLWLLAALGSTVEHRPSPQ
ncbi:MAG: hypothetical protein RR301_04470 [Clostridia bacterium]